MLVASSAVAVGAAALTIVGCGDRKKAPNNDQPLPGGTLRTGTTLPIAAGLDP